MVTPCHSCESIARAGIQSPNGSGGRPGLPLSRAKAGVTKKQLLARSASPAPRPFAEAGITHKDVDHLMIYDVPCSVPGARFAHLPIYGLLVC